MALGKVMATVGESSGELFGHPRGLSFLSFAEAFERFSYYGMQSLLVLYMTHSLLQPRRPPNFE